MNVIDRAGGLQKWPEALLAQLKNGGRLLPVSWRAPCEVRLGYKSDHASAGAKLNAAAPLRMGLPARRI